MTSKEIRDLSAAFAASTFSVFKDVVASGGEVRGCVVKGGAKYSRKDLDELIELARAQGASGLVWSRNAGGAIGSSALKAAGEATIRQALQTASAAEHRANCQPRQQFAPDHLPDLLRSEIRSAVTRGPSML